VVYLWAVINMAPSSEVPLEAEKFLGDLVNIICQEELSCLLLFGYEYPSCSCLFFLLTYFFPITLPLRPYHTSGGYA
jgi:hypothetical protein